MGYLSVRKTTQRRLPPVMPRSSHSGFEIAEYPLLQWIFWTFQRIGWIVLVFVLLSALFGIAGGGGILSSRTILSKGGQVTYQTILRKNMPSQLSLRSPTATGATRVDVILNRSFLDNVAIESIQPPPLASVAGEDFTLFRFLRNAQRPQFSVSLLFHPLRSGDLQVRIGVDEGAVFSFSQFVLP